MKRLSSFLVSLSSLKFSVFLLVAFLLLTFWGVLAQANAESIGLSAADAANRFFNGYFVWALGWVPVPAFKTLAVLASLHLVLSMAYRMPRLRGNREGWRNLGLYGMHVALLILMVGGLVGSAVKQEFNGYAVLSAQEFSQMKFFAVDDSLGQNPVSVQQMKIQGASAADLLALGNAQQGAEPVLKAGWPYDVQYRGRVEMSSEKHIALYRATYDPFRWVPYAFMFLFVASAAFHYGFRIRKRGAASTRLPEDTSAQREGSHRWLYFGAMPLLSIVLVGFVAVVAAFEGKNVAHDGKMTSGPVSSLGTEQRSSGGGMPASTLFPLVTVDGHQRPFDSFARGVLDDFCGRVTYRCHPGEASGCPRRMEASEVVRSIVQTPAAAGGMSLFRIQREGVSHALRLPPEARYVSYAELLQARSLLEVYASREDSHPVTAEMQRLYANVLMFESLARGRIAPLDTSGTSLMAPALARDSTMQWNAGTVPFRGRLEVLYHRVNLCLWAFILTMAETLLSLLNLQVQSRRLDRVSNVCGAASAATLLAMLVMRFVVEGHPPMANLYEIVLWIAFLLQAFEWGAFTVCRRRTFELMIPVAVVTGVLLFFAKFILETGDTFQSIPAVLNSSAFLTMHVFTIAVGFAAMILSGVIAHVCLFRLSRLSGKNGMAETPDEQTPLENLLYKVLAFGSILTILGTLLGGVWADVAWGRFWGFDPKECGALFVALWGMLGLHLRSCSTVKKKHFVLYNSFNVVIVFLCWFGINLLGIGLHSYGFQDVTAIGLVAFTLLEALLILFAVF